MSSLVSHSELKFLLDENVDDRLGKFLKSEGFDVSSAPKGFSNGKLAPISKSEGRILVTNDFDFTDPIVFPKEKIFSVVWLRIPQDRLTVLFNSFSILLKNKSKPEDFEGFLIELGEDGKFKSSPLKSLKFVRFTK